MSIYKIEWVGDTPNEWGEGTEKTYYYQVAGTFEGQKKSTSIGVKDKARAPKAGDEIEGSFYMKNGKEKFAKARPAGAGYNRGGFQKPTYTPSPATEIPYLSLKAAVELAGYNIQSGKTIKGADVVKLAQVFQNYLEGELKPKDISPVDEKQEQLPVDENNDFSDIDQYMEGE